MGEALEKLARYEEAMEQWEAELRKAKVKATPENNAILESYGVSTLRQGMSVRELARRPGVNQEVLEALGV